MPWQWQFSSEYASPVSISSDCRETLLKQLSCGNRIVLTGLSKTKWSSCCTIGKMGHSYVFNAYVFLGDNTYMWLTNDDRRKLLRNLRSV